jgi:membrane protease YdiL (CAAX protease family)
VLAHGLKFNWVQLTMATMAAMATIALTVVYLWRRDLASNVIAHALIDLVSFARALR